MCVARLGPSAVRVHTEYRVQSILCTRNTEYVHSTQHTDILTYCRASQPRHHMDGTRRSISLVMPHPKGSGFLSCSIRNNGNNFLYYLVTQNFTTQPAARTFHGSWWVLLFILLWNSRATCSICLYQSMYLDLSCLISPNLHHRTF